jgi:hypothetical protein
VTVALLTTLPLPGRASSLAKDDSAEGNLAATVALQGRLRAFIRVIGWAADGNAFAFVVTSGDGRCAFSTARLVDGQGIELDHAEHLLASRASPSSSEVGQDFGAVKRE